MCFSNQRVCLSIKPVFVNQTNVFINQKECVCQSKQCVSQSKQCVCQSKLCSTALLYLGTSFSGILFSCSERRLVCRLCSIIRSCLYKVIVFPETHTHHHHNLHHISPSDLLCLRSSRPMYSASTINYLLLFFYIFYLNIMIKTVGNINHINFAESQIS